jgi:hypothetical protein
MSLLLWGLTLGTIGKIILGVAVLRVHLRMFEERDIEGTVLTAIKREHWATIIALIMIVIGYLLEVIFYNGSTEFFTCVGAECGAAINAAFSR